jgi:hypothetical protein
VLVAPDGQVQEAGQVLVSNGVFGPRPAVLQPVLVQHEEVQPVVERVARRLCRPHPVNND